MRKASAYGDISDKGLAQIAKLPNLETLRITGVMTDQGLRSLVGLKKLRELEIDSSNITDRGIKWLRTAMPKLEINGE
ncbi:MAG TPA: hypothetical protein VHY91_16800 [Pirellulales bacterium]|jgi:hypothetical protein|nr:hypothetical protein [Pirellulales bacterium]HEX4145168.1 hypothetical protein [Pirellulales bacterium]